MELNLSIQIMINWFGRHNSFIKGVSLFQQISIVHYLVFVLYAVISACSHDSK